MKFILILAVLVLPLVSPVTFVIMWFFLLYCINKKIL